jgi:hypothetical protein
MIGLNLIGLVGLGYRASTATPVFDVTKYECRN